jgi:hypothetical protein
MFFCLLVGSRPAQAEQVPEIPETCQAKINQGQECLISEVRCDNILCLTGEFHHELFVKLERSAIGTKEEAIQKITRYEMWPEAVRRRDPKGAILRVHTSIKGPFLYDENQNLLEAIQYADFEASSPIGWQPMTMVNRFQIVENADSPSFGNSFLTTRVLVDTGFDVGKIAKDLPGSRGIKYMDGFLHLVEDRQDPTVMYAVYSHKLRIGFDLAPKIAEVTIGNVIRTITGALIDVMSTPRL